MKHKLLGVLLLVASCTGGPEERYLDWMYESMALPDSLGYSRKWWAENVAKTLEVRDCMGWDVPEREFRHFVLPLRVNNETLDDFRTLYADTLCSRVKGMTMAEAAVEINHWCHEQATYEPSDARTSSPTATMRNGTGRCGEESVLAVAALRAAGIPARQVYTPRWAHTDDNHAWVEVWINGKWHFMGACEPEPRLDMGWFNAPVSRAMLLHTKVFGDYKGDEDVIRRTPTYTEINVIKGYIDSRRTCVKVVDISGRPVEGANVRFTIYNYGEFYCVASYLSDRKGRASLNTGCGDMLVTASFDGAFGFAVASGAETETVLDHRYGEAFSADVTIVPPVENPIPSLATEEEIERNTVRLAREDSIRRAHPHNNPDLEEFLSVDDSRRSLLVSLLSEKDCKDVTSEVLYDAFLVPSSDPDVLNPRVANEELRPLRGLVGGRDFGSYEAVAQWIKDSITVVQGRNPQGLSIPPASVWTSRLSDEKSLDLFYVALCRACGLPARLDPVTGRIDGLPGPGVVPESADSLSEGKLILYTESSVTPLYYRHFTISEICSDGSSNLLEFGADSDFTPIDVFKSGVSLSAGYYCVTSGTRMADGSVLAHMEFFNIPENCEVSIPVIIRKSESKLSVVGNIDAERFISETGRGYFMIAVMGSGDEPTNHARRELAGISSAIEDWGRPVLTYNAGERGSFGSEAEEVFDMLISGCGSSSKALPVIAVCDSFGRVVYFSQGYNTSLGSDITNVISQLN